MEVNKDNTVDKAINRESFVFRWRQENFDIKNWELLDWLNKTLLRDLDVVVSRNWEKFEISIDENWTAFLRKADNADRMVEFTETMIDNYKVVKREAESGSKWIWYLATKTWDYLQKRRVVWLAIKYPRRFIKSIENTTSEVKSFFQSPENPNIQKINKYNFIFREKTLGNNPQDIVKLKKAAKKWLKSTFNIWVSPNVEFSYNNRKTCKDIRRTGVLDGDLIVDQNWKEFVAKSEWWKMFLYWISTEKLWKRIEFTDNKINDYRVVKREWKRTLWYSRGRIADFSANNIPLANIAILGWRDAVNTVNKKLWKNKFEETKRNNKIESDLNKVESFDDLYSEIDKLKKIKCESIWETYSPEQLKVIIEKVRIWDLDIKKIPEELWLRDKVEELAKAEKNKKNSNKKIIV
jgi:hypothetical protein